MGPDSNVILTLCFLLSLPSSSTAGHRPYQSRSYQMCVVQRYSMSQEQEDSEAAYTPIFHMMTSSDGNIIRVTGALLALCAFSGHRWIPLTKASDAELWFFSLICAWTNGWANNRNAAELRRHGAHYDVIVVTSMNVLLLSKCFSPSWTQREYRRICSHNGAGILFMNTNFKLTFAFFSPNVICRNVIWFW